MRSIWEGSISFGLVNIPVKLMVGSKSNDLDLDMLRKSDLCPVKYVRMCKRDNKEIPYDEIVKGYEYSDGQYVVLTDEDFENVNVEKTHRIDILDFVNEEEIDIRYYEKPYYLQPDESAGKLYVLLREALKQSRKAGIASYVLRNRGHIGIIKAIGDVIILNQIRYVKELVKPDELKIPEKIAISDKEIELALTLIDQLAAKFEPEKYKDTYAEDLKKIVDQKVAGQHPEKKGKEPQPIQVEDMMALLKKSIEEKKKKAA